MLPYLYPLVGGWYGREFTGPSWYWNPWQWPLNAWPNVVITVAGFIGWVYIAVRLDRTWFEFIWLRFDKEICRCLRKWFGGQAAENWSETEARLIQQSYLFIATAAFLGCIVAAAGA